ncbi:S8 family peptidase [Polaribacter tangerinus]|uniref:S8 family peptidase n=1 Tax=Polaribacter tangerinus TaxID=1920034 RepID=UPI000B4B542D|nr:S8 family peptidase [Polaribacter tangerinus]
MRNYLVLTILFTMSSLLGQNLKDKIEAKRLTINKNEIRFNKKKNVSINTALLINDFKKALKANQIKKEQKFESTYGKETFVDAFIKTDNDFDISKLKRLGVDIYIDLEEMLVVGLPVKNLEKISDLEGVIFIQVASRVEKQLDESLILTRTNEVHNGVTLSQAYSGKGVVVGVIDIGFDYTHPNFYSVVDGSYRISRVWEQTNSKGIPPANFNFGTELIGESSLLSKKYDLVNDSHGSHVAGIAAGSGITPGSIYRGVAYDSEIVLVSTKTTNISVLEGIYYIINYAKSVNKPAVINISLGNHYGPHDGTSFFDKSLDKIIRAAGPGYVVVGAAGNSGNNNIHLTKKFTNTENYLYSFLDFRLGQESPYQYSVENGPVKSKIYLTGSKSQQFSVALYIYNVKTKEIVGGTKSYSSINSCAPCTPDEGFKLIDSDFINPDEVVVKINISNDSDKPYALIDIDNSLQDDVNHAILIEVKSTSGRVHLWQQDDNVYFTSLHESVATDGDSNFTVTEVGGTSNSIISVGAFNSKSCTTRLFEEGTNSCDYDTEELLHIANFSSKGPTTDLRIKPDISAPGNRIVSSISSFDTNYLPKDGDFSNSLSYRDVESSFGNNDRKWYFAASHGTSMAAPIVTGIVALMLEANPKLYTNEVKSILQSTAINDSYTEALTSTPNYSWGAGKVDALASVTLVEKTLSEKDILLKEMNIYPNPMDQFLSFNNNEYLFDILEITNTLGQKLKTINLKNNQQKVDVSKLSPGLYLFNFKKNGIQKSLKLLKK